MGQYSDCSMEDFFNILSQNQLLKTATKLDDLNGAWFRKSKKPRPPGYAAVTRMSLWSKQFDVLLCGINRLNIDCFKGTLKGTL